YKRNNLNYDDICSIGITNQRETTCAYDKKGNPLAKAIVWQDRRTESFCETEKENFKDLSKLTGLPLDAYFSATKMKWLLENNENVKSAAKGNNLNLSTIESFLLFKLTNCTEFSTEPTNASRTNLMNLKTCNWDQSLLSFFKIDSKFLPNIKETFSDFGETKNLSFLPDGITINCLIGDQQSALFGQTCFEKGSLKCTYGTGAFLLLNIGEEVIHSDSGLLTTVAYQYQGKNFYALEGSCYIAGAAVQWLRDNIKIIDSSPDVENLAKKVINLEEMENILFLPFFTGIGSPHWISNAKAAIIGLTRDTSNAHIARACLEGIALSINDLINAFEKDGGQMIDNIRVDGGACSNDLLMTIQSTFSNKTILRPDNIETTSTGAAFGAAIGKGLVTISDLKDKWSLNKEFKPENKNVYYKHKQDQWQKYIKINFL
ncbi:MAG: glycerol kinase, partial [Thermoproteota archaeon]